MDNLTLSKTHITVIYSLCKNKHHSVIKEPSTRIKEGEMEQEKPEHTSNSNKTTARAPLLAEDCDCAGSESCGGACKYTRLLIILKRLCVSVLLRQQAVE
jgi:hypothetical protein